MMVEVEGSLKRHNYQNLTFRKIVGGKIHDLMCFISFITRHSSKYRVHLHSRQFVVACLASFISPLVPVEISFHSGCSNIDRWWQKSVDLFFTSSLCIDHLIYLSYLLQARPECSLTWIKNFSLNFWREKTQRKN